MVYSVLGAVGPRATASPVALSLGNDGSHLRRSRRHGSSLRGLLRLHVPHVELDKPPRLNDTKSETSPRRNLVEFVFFLFYADRKSKCLLGDSLFDQSDANQIKGKKDWRGIIKKVSREGGPLRHTAHLSLRSTW